MLAVLFGLLLANRCELCILGEGCLSTCMRACICGDGTESLPANLQTAFSASSLHLSPSLTRPCRRGRPVRSADLPRCGHARRAATRL